MASLASWDAAGVEFSLDDGSHVRLTARDLLECAPDQFDADSGQRLTPIQDLPIDPSIVSATSTDGAWRIDIDTLGPVTFTAADLAPYLFPAPLGPRPVTWLQPPHESRAAFDYRTYFDDAETRRRCLANVARFGWARLTGAPRETGEVERFIGSFGYVRETNYGRIFDVRVKRSAENLAYTDRALEPHADNPYRDPTPGVQVLHCLEGSDNGGESRLVDGRAVAEALRQSHPDHYLTLSRIPVRFEWSDANTRLAAEAPIISLDVDGAFRGMRFNHRSFRAIRAPADDRQRWREAYRPLAAMINAPANGIEFKLAPGEMVIMDNRRVLHGRLAFRDAGANARHLQGAYADMDGLASTLAILFEQEASRRVARIEEIFASERMSLDYGERLSIREHMLQAANLAADQGAGAELIAAGLLHDIGWGLEGEETGHARTGASLIEPLFGAGVGNPVRWHIQAKRYLVAREDGYRERLSDASRHTLELQGGALSAQESQAFETEPAFDQAIRLRRMDDEAKCVGRQVRPFAHYRPLLHRLALTHLYS